VAKPVRSALLQGPRGSLSGFENFVRSFFGPEEARTRIACSTGWYFVVHRTPVFARVVFAGPWISRSTARRNSHLRRSPFMMVLRWALHCRRCSRRSHRLPQEDFSSAEAGDIIESQLEMKPPIRLECSSSADFTILVRLPRSFVGNRRGDSVNVSLLDPIVAGIVGVGRCKSS